MNFAKNPPTTFFFFKQVRQKARAGFLVKTSLIFARLLAVKASLATTSIYFVLSTEVAALFLLFSFPYALSTFEL